MAELLLPLLVRDTAGAYGAARDERVAARATSDSATSSSVRRGRATPPPGAARLQLRALAVVRPDPLETAHPEGARGGARRAPCIATAA